MDKSVLIQYISLKAEIADLEELIKKTQKEINKLEKSNCQVSDSVKGTRKDVNLWQYQNNRLSISAV